jgi:hypothetical protein
VGQLSESALEVRLAVTLFLLLIGLADLFGAWQVSNFASFTPRGVAAVVMPQERHEMPMACCMSSSLAELPVEPESLNKPAHRIERELLVQDTHVHIPVYAMTAAFLALIVLGLRMSSPRRVLLILLAFAAPFADFAGLWGAHLFPRAGALLGGLAVAGGFAMGICYAIILVVALRQFWFPRKESRHA